MGTEISVTEAAKTALANQILSHTDTQLRLSTIPRPLPLPTNQQQEQPSPLPPQPHPQPLHQQEQQRISTRLEFDLDCDPGNLQKYSTSNCNRCKKIFAQIGPKPFKLCSHCRHLQRQRSRRWQLRTKEKDGACRRCGAELSEEGLSYVLCQHCRDTLRLRKANRVIEGKCVHCAGPNEDEGKFKVCRRCRDKDKIRRITLEQEGACNRCAQKLSADDRSHKVCSKCRIRKKKDNSAMASNDAFSERSIVRNISVDQLFVDDKNNNNEDRKEIASENGTRNDKNQTNNDENQLDRNLNRSNNSFESQLQEHLLLASTQSHSLDLSKGKMAEVGVTMDPELLTDGNSSNIKKKSSNFNLNSKLPATASKSNDKHELKPSISGDPQAILKQKLTQNQQENMNSKQLKSKKQIKQTPELNSNSTSSNNTLLKLNSDKTKKKQIKRKQPPISSINQEPKRHRENSDSGIESQREHERDDHDNQNDVNNHELILSDSDTSALLSIKERYENDKLSRHLPLSMHHDHSQLNQQLKQLSQFTSQATDSESNKYDGDSVLVDLDGLGVNIGQALEMTIGDDDEGYAHLNVSVGVDEGENERDEDPENEEEDNDVEEEDDDVSQGLVNLNDVELDRQTADVAAAVAAAAAAAAGSINMPDSNKLCVGCHGLMDIEDVSMNPEMNYCSKCYMER